MAQFYQIHPQNPQSRLISQAVALLRNGGLMAYPTDSGYALGCHIGDKKALDKIRSIRSLDKAHNFTLVCRDLSELAIYARVDNPTFRVLKNHTPGPYTFILRATTEVPNRLQHASRKTIGIRVPDNTIVLSLLESLGEPIMSSSLIMPEHQQALSSAEEIYQRLKGRIDLVIDGGFVGNQPTTVIEMLDGVAKVVRHGAGDPSLFE